MLASLRAARQGAMILINAQHEFAIFPFLVCMNGWEKWLHQPPDLNTRWIIS